MDNYVITIQRTYGSGGRTMGKLLAEELGIDCYDMEILRLASDESGIREELFGKADEKLTGFPSFRIVKSPAYLDDKIIPPSESDFTSKENLFNYQAKVIKELAKTSSCIIIGRCADYILRDYDNVIKLYFYAPFDDCMERVRKLYFLDDKAIEKRIKKVDKARAEYYEYYTGRNFFDASNYDMCLNTGSLSYDKCKEMVKQYMRICKNIDV
ncbi:Cytidylate kinase [Acetitomaculum ruminis DSM 5522]|uniref:Cytidylate kinase n=1 Tax=Acetitomaculum ruminis DSM 5522 TaxID=1120918 RepID=A0A1I0XCD4_9FIRM|nr:cytidylate kinase-like family protein [Acetitomaculum ruminis]SFA98544.1 Cytidylate kinase [Acetitomaculum ruminis DSM 5522]